jgi:hypothetical protein
LSQLSLNDSGNSHARSKKAVAGDKRAVWREKNSDQLPGVAAHGPEQASQPGGVATVFGAGSGVSDGSRMEHQTTNLGVRSSNLFGRARKPLKTLGFQRMGRP